MQLERDNIIIAEIIEAVTGAEFSLRYWLHNPHDIIGTIQNSALLRTSAPDNHSLHCRHCAH
jgi:hypothetical protein